MKNKGLLLILLLSCILLSTLLYINYLDNKICFNNADNYEKIEVFSKYNHSKVDACFGNKIKCTPITYKIQGMVNTKRLGTYVVTYRAKKDDKESIINKKVEVVDTKKPALKITGEFNNVCPSGKTNDVSYLATDNYDGDITDKIKYKIENGKIIYKVSDSSGNIAKKEFDVTIKDDEKPTLILNGDETIYLVVGNNYEELGYVAIDNCDGNITQHVNVEGKVNTKKAGTYELTYSVKDEYGNINVVKRTIKVLPKNNYKPGIKTDKTIYLTFDDGPGEHTERLLDILKKYDVKATFFITGYDNKYNELITRQSNEGHTVGLHSYTHNYSLIYLSVDAFMQDLLKIQEKVKKYTGEYSKVIRFPGGSSNTISRLYKKGIMGELTSYVKQQGYRYFDWTILSGDAGETTNTNKIIENVTYSLTPDGLNVVLMHDIKSYSVDAVEAIIQYGLEKGYTFAPLTMQSPNVQHSVNN